MKILIASDSFKDALPAVEVCQAIAKGTLRAAPEASIQLLPLADGGEGTAALLTHYNQGNTIYSTASDPVFRPVRASFGLSKDKKTAFLEMAQASGLQRLNLSERNPLRTSTLGTGEMIHHAILKGAKHIVLGIGGSATNDLGIGMAHALGYRFLDQSGNEVPPIGGNLSAIQEIDDSNLVVDLAKVSFEVLCDVENPLFGPNGATYVYGPQKGASREALELLDKGIEHLNEKLAVHFGKNVSQVPGAGASGGLGAGSLYFLNADLRSGIDILLEHSKFNKHLNHTNLLLTGEGKIDVQTANGKLIQGITKMAKAKNIPVIALCGTLEADFEVIESIGLTAAFSILRRPQTLKEALQNTADSLENTAYQLIRTRFF